MSGPAIADAQTAHGVPARPARLWYKTQARCVQVQLLPWREQPREVQLMRPHEPPTWFRPVRQHRQAEARLENAGEEAQAGGVVG
jgi:hypothetical protein